MEYVNLEKCSKNFGNQQVLKEISYSFCAGGYCISGENGSGKSTLLKMMMGLILPDTGCVTVIGEKSENLSSSVKAQIGYMFSSDRTLYYKLTARENLEMIGSIYGLKGNHLKDRVSKVLQLVELEDNKKYIETYSTGMKKRLMLARAILYNPKVLFLDEPYSGLDERGCHLLTETLENEVSKGKCVIVVSHQLEYIPSNWKLLSMKKGELCSGL